MIWKKKPQIFIGNIQVALQVGESMNGTASGPRESKDGKKRIEELVDRNKYDIALWLLSVPADSIEDNGYLGF